MKEATCQGFLEDYLLILTKPEGTKSRTSGCLTSAIKR